MSGQPHDEPVGSLVEEAGKLLGALSGWAREQTEAPAEVPGESVTAGVWAGLTDHLDGSPECSWCPVCRGVRGWRETSPEVKAHLGQAASSLLLAVTGLLSTTPPASDDDPD